MPLFCFKHNFFICRKPFSITINRTEQPRLVNAYFQNLDVLKNVFFNSSGLLQTVHRTVSVTGISHKMAPWLNWSLWKQVQTHCFRFTQIKYAVLFSFCHSTCHFQSYFPSFYEKIIYMNILAIINVDILSHNDANIIRALIYGDPSLIGLTYTLILNISIQFLLSSNWFDGPLV